MFNKKKQDIDNEQLNKQMDPNPPFYKRGWFIGLAGVIIGAAIIGGDDEETAVEPDVEEVVETEEVEAEEELDIVEEPEEEEEVVEEEPEEEPEEPEEDIIEEEEPEEVVEEEPVEEEEAVEELVEEVDVEVEEDFSDEELSVDFVVSYLQGTEMGDMGVFGRDDELEAITYLPQDQDVADAFAYMALGIGLDEYDNMVDNYIYLSESIAEMTDVGLILLNPNNPENILLWVHDGLIIYDFADEL